MVRPCSFAIYCENAQIDETIRQRVGAYGRHPPGGDGARWDTPEKKAQAIERLGRWQRYRPVPLQRLYIPKKNGKRRPLAMPARGDRARQALSLHALQPIAATVAAPNA